MEPIAIQTRSLGKRYRILHRAGGSVPDTLRDALARKARALFSRRKGGSFSTREEFWALRGVDFSVARGERVGIIGRNGSGKSTLLKLLSRITPPSAGGFTIRGRVASLLEVGTGFHPELTGRENIFTNGAILGMSRREIKARFDEIVAFAEIEKFLDTPIKRYSSGMAVRLAFSVAAHLEAEILLLDEVLAVGDVAFQQKCLGKMREVSQGGRTILFVSHNMAAIMNLCDRSLWLHDGRLMEDGPSPAVVREFLKSGGSAKSGAICFSGKEGPAPGNEQIRLLSITMASPSGPCHQFEITEPVRIHLIFENLVPGQAYIWRVHLKDQNGAFVLTSVSGPSASLAPDPLYGEPLPRGRFETVCEIPPHTLNQGQFTVCLSVAANGNLKTNPIIRDRDLIRFGVNDNGSMSAEYSGAWRGPARPLLSWQTRALDGTPDPLGETP